MPDDQRTAVLSDASRALFEGGNIVTVATVNPDGGPQTTPVWARMDGGTIVFSTVAGRRKALNLIRDPRVSLSVFDPHTPFHRAEVRGRAVLEPDPDGALIAELSLRYTGEHWVEADPSARRVIVRVTPRKVVER